MSQTFEDEAGITRLKGTLKGLPASGIPQGGPLTQDLDPSSFGLASLDPNVTPYIAAASQAGGTGGTFTVTPAGLGGGGGGSTSQGGVGATGVDGGPAALTGGRGDNNTTIGAQVQALGGTPTLPGRASIRTGNTRGTSGLALVSDGAQGLIYGGVVTGAGVPVNPPAGSLPFAFDVTAVTGGFYFWNGGAWVKLAAIL